MPTKRHPRRSIIGCVARRMKTLQLSQAGRAWHSLADELEAMEQKDVPKYADIVRAMRSATIKGKK